MNAPDMLPLIHLPLLGLDSFVAGLLIGPLLRSRQHRALLAGAFGICDGLGTWVGALLPHSLPDTPDVAFYALAALAVVIAARRSARWLAVVPALLALDNLMAGAPAASALALAVSSGLMAWAGMTLSGCGWLSLRHLLARIEAPNSHSWPPG